MKQPSNNARLKCFADYVPLTDVEVVDVKQKIWKGVRIIEPGTRDDVCEIIYFSRDYHPNDIDLDKAFTEKHIMDSLIIGFEFWLIPKNKMLFGYDPPSEVIKPDIKLVKGPGFSI